MSQAFEKNFVFLLLVQRMRTITLKARARLKRKGMCTGRAQPTCMSKGNSFVYLAIIN